MKYVNIGSLVFILFLASCAHNGVAIEGMNHPLVQIKSKVMNILPLGLREKSQNGREYFSQYFVMSNGKAFSGKSHPQRKMVRIMILGDRRPYEVVVTVFIQKRIGRKGNGSPVYKNISFDKAMAKRLANTLRTQLNNRREDMNVIDDFKVF